MATQQPSLFALYPPGFPSAVVVGTVVNLLLFVPGEPIPKGRHRARVVAPKGGKPFVQTYPDKKTEEWETYVADTIKEQITSIPVTGSGQDFKLPLDGRVWIKLRFNMHKPVSYPASVVHHTKRPDVDNLAKAILDAMNKRIFADDGQVTDLSIAKRYIADEHPEGVEIDITAFG